MKGVFGLLTVEIDLFDSNERDGRLWVGRLADFRVFKSLAFLRLFRFMFRLLQGGQIG